MPDENVAQPETSRPTPNKDATPIPVMVEPTFTIEAPTNNPGGIEREVFGKWTVILRNVTGALAVLTTCVTAILNAVSVNHSVVAGQGWPDMWIMFIVMVGPVIVAWTWINANKTLSTLLEGTSLTTKVRGKMAEIIAPHPRPEYPPTAPPPGPYSGYGQLDDRERRPLPESTPQPPPAAPTPYTG